MMHKKTVEKKSHSEKAPSDLVHLNMQLQNKNIELLQSMHSLTKRIDNLISIFEEAAKNVSNLDEDNRIKELTDKLETLLDQNKNLANGLMMLEKYVKSKSLEQFKRL